MKRFILGVDGGGTKSHLAVFDEHGTLAGAAVYGSLNHEGMDGSFAELEEKLFELLPRVLGDAGISAKDIAFAVLGLAGVDTPPQAQIISKMIDAQGIRDYIVCNDAILGVPAGCPGGSGICAINGTGFKLAAIDRGGTVFDTCGLGAYTDDRGGGTWYGERVCGEVYNEIYKLGRPTIMRDMLFKLLGISRREDYSQAISRIYYAESELYNSPALNGMVFEAAALGDDAALDILSESAAQYAGAISRLAMDMDFSPDLPLYVTLAGSVFVKQPVKILHEMIERQVAKALFGRQVRYICLDAPPVAGAVLWAAEKAGFSFDESAVKSAIKSAF
ncbi:MAG: hypothetical protein FWH17_03490 [Oscillospiraceae bacterium]|nr:hypothetical protein [Oscillospiraceae bacterium]